VFLLGHADDAEATRAQTHQARQVTAAERESAAQAPWDTLLGATWVITPEPLFDAMVKRWLLYKSVSSQLWAKAVFIRQGAPPAAATSCKTPWRWAGFCAASPPPGSLWRGRKAKLGRCSTEQRRWLAGNPLSTPKPGTAPESSALSLTTAVRSARPASPRPTLI
jgi:hypothetical protein